MDSDNLFVKCKRCDKFIPKSAKICPQCGKKRQKLTILHWIVITIGFFTFLRVVNILESASTKHTNTAFGGNKTSTKPTTTQPPDQEKFIDIVLKSANKYIDAKNELQRFALKEERKSLLSTINNNFFISEWSGTINFLETNNDGDAILSICISPNIEVKTWNNAISDLDSHTLISKGSDLYRRLLNFSVGQRVRFSGSFFPSREDYFEETSMTLEGSMKNPEFLFKFKTIDILN